VANTGLINTTLIPENRLLRLASKQFHNTGLNIHIYRRQGCWNRLDGSLTI